MPGADAMPILWSSLQPVQVPRVLVAWFAREGSMSCTDHWIIGWDGWLWLWVVKRGVKIVFGPLGKQGCWHVEKICRKYAENMREICNECAQKNPEKSYILHVHAP
jgi:hypothetical protein